MVSLCVNYFYYHLKAVSIIQSPCNDENMLLVVTSFYGAYRTYSTLVGLVDK